MNGGEIRLLYQGYHRDHRYGAFNGIYAPSAFQKGFKTAPKPRYDPSASKPPFATKDTTDKAKEEAEEEAKEEAGEEAKEEAGGNGNGRGERSDSGSESLLSLDDAGLMSCSGSL